MRPPVSRAGAYRALTGQREPGARPTELETGPTYSYNRVLRPVLEEVEVDLYPTLGDYQAARGIE